MLSQVEIHLHDQWTLDCEEWDANRYRERREEERHTKEHNQRIRRKIQAHLEVCRRREREAHKSEREKKREMTVEANAADEEYNTELARKGKWPWSIQ